MIPEGPGTLVSDSPRLSLRMPHGSTTTFDPDLDSSQPNLFLIPPYFGEACYDARFLGHSVGGLYNALGDDMPRPISDARFLGHSTKGFFHTLTDDLRHEISLRRDEFVSKTRQARETHLAYRRRIESLRGDAALDGFTLNEVSESDFWSFVGSAFPLQKAGLVLMDNGNLRAVWKDEHGSHLGLQFLGNCSVEYVIFKRREAARDVSRGAGIDTLDGIKRQIHAFDLTALVYA